MRHINRRCSANNGSLHQMLNKCLFSALPKASEDLLSERRQTGWSTTVEPTSADVGTCPGDQQLTSGSRTELLTFW